MNTHFDTVAKNIGERRSIKPKTFNGKTIADEAIKKLLQLATHAPNHGDTEPWHFEVFSGNGVRRFCERHAELYKAITDPVKYDKTKYDKIIVNGSKASHIIIVIMQRGSLPKIPAWEEIAAASAAVQNILLGATAMGIASFWGTGGLVHNPVMKTLFNLKEEDQIVASIFLGYSDTVPKERHSTPAEEKTTWNRIW